MNTTPASSALSANAPSPVLWPESSMSLNPLEIHWAESSPGWRSWDVAITRCKTTINSYRDLPPSMALHKQRRQPMFDAIPPPYLTLDQEFYYDAQYEKLIDSLNVPITESRHRRTDRASHARNALWKLWFHSRAEWIRRGSPPVNENTRPYWP